MLTVFLDHRYDVVRRRSQFRRNKKAERLHLVDGLLIALLDIDEVIQVIRTSDDSAAAKERLISVFDLSQAQADYILEMQLRRLTRFSRIELEKEQETLRREIEELEAILADEDLLKRVVSDELGEVAKTFGTPRRTVLLESAGTAAVTAAAAPLEVPDDPCFALLSSTGLLARTSSDEPVGTGGARANHDVVVSAVRATARGEIGVLTSAGRVVRLGVLDLPAIPPSANEPNLQGGVPLTELISLDSGERALALCTLATDGPGLALGTRHGVVKRVNPEVHRQGRVGRHPASRTTTRSSARSSCAPATRSSASSPPTPSSCTSPRPACAPRVARAAAWPASGWPPASAWSGSARSTWRRTPTARCWSPPPAPRPRSPAPSRVRSR